MRRILLGLVLVLGAGGVVMSGATGAFFSDTETSTGNSFTAGAIDLLIDNESYYNGNVCAVDAQDVDGDQNITEYVWQGSALFPVPGTNCTTSFEPSNLDGLLFFDFRDLKPDDEGEDTISIDVQNDAWICMDLTLTSDDDKSSTEPELSAPDLQEDPGDAWDGELAAAINFFWWADDGDNVYEVGENPITNGIVSLANLDATFPIAIADSENNVWGLPDGTPVPANQTVYVAKAWCMGTLTLDPVPAGQGTNPSNDPGVNCDGTLLGNETQTDQAELNIVFSAVQSRNNGDFLCNPRQPQTATLTVNKVITADTAGIGVEDFELHINGPGGDQIVGDNIPIPGLTPGAYTVSEIILVAGLPPGVTFTSTIGGACAVNGTVTLNPGDNLVCTINNVENLD
ncbi:MAG: hypothetical protein G01um101456_575 [Parcubacteria group bacterium Gr01-1014_56]|nr:MAG: hypothetical protein G01um101456_575 [Parcubacteria group bacterium Gr01-1014_56]